MAQPKDAEIRHRRDLLRYCARQLVVLNLWTAGTERRTVGGGGATIDDGSRLPVQLHRELRMTHCCPDLAAPSAASRRRPHHWPLGRRAAHLEVTQRRRYILHPRGDCAREPEGRRKAWRSSSLWSLPRPFLEGGRGGGSGRHAHLPKDRSSSRRRGKQVLTHSGIGPVKRLPSTSNCRGREGDSKMNTPSAAAVDHRMA